MRGEVDTCPTCEVKALKVIYSGLPLLMCDKCTTIWGFWSWVPRLWFNGYLFIYKGSYLKGLWEWLTYE